MFCVVVALDVLVGNVGGLVGERLRLKPVADGGQLGDGADGLLVERGLAVDLGLLEELLVALLAAKLLVDDLLEGLLDVAVGDVDVPFLGLALDPAGLDGVRESRLLDLLELRTSSGGELAKLKVEGGLAQVLVELLLRDRAVGRLLDEGDVAVGDRRVAGVAGDDERPKGDDQRQPEDDGDDLPLPLEACTSAEA